MSFFHRNGQLGATGSYSGEYRRVLYDTKAVNLITLDRNLDTISVEKYTGDKVDSLKTFLQLKDFIAFPAHLHYKTGLWKYYDAEGRLMEEEWYDDKGKLIRTEKKYIDPSKL